MKRQQLSVLLAGALALSQLAACSSIGSGWRGLFGNSPMPAQAATAPAPAHSATAAATPAVTASAAANGNASGTEKNAPN